MQLLSRLGGSDAERTALDIARHVAHEGWRSVVVSAGGRLERELAGSGVHHVTLPLDHKSPLAIAANIGRIARAARRHGIGLIHAHARAPAWSGAFAARQVGAAFMTSVHAIPGGHDRPLRRRFNAIMTAGDRLVTSCEHVTEHLLQFYGADAERIRLIHPGIDTIEFDPDRVRGHRIAPLAERWNLGFGRKIVLLPGRVIRVKGHLRLLEAMARMARDDFMLLIVGPLDPDSGYVRELDRTIRREGLGERVRFGGDCADMPAALMLANVVTVPAVGPEGFGRVVVEAQAMGKPVIVTGTGALGESLEPGRTGWLLEAADPAELALALDAALSLSEAERLEIGHRARAFAIEGFDKRDMCARYGAVYRELLRTAPQPALLAEGEAAAH
jgi:glycosyltransferase involved in cell wall biosynthesis